MYRSNDYYREVIFNEWFSKHTKIFEMMKDGKFCDIRINIEYAPFINTFNKIYRSNLRYYDTTVDCYADCVALLWEGMLKFEIKNDSTWERIANKEDVDNYRKLVSYLKTYITQNIKRLNQDFIETSKNFKDGKVKKNIHLAYSITPQSLNQIVTFNNTLEQIELIDTVQNSYWEKKANYRYGIFAEWAKDNMHQYLTKSQKELLEKLQSANYSSYDNEYDRKILENGKGQIKLRLERICDKVSAKYEEQQKLITGGYVVQEIENEIKTYQKFINVLSDENNEDAEQTLVQIIVSSMNNPYWERLIYEDLSEEAQYDIIWAYQHGAVVYEDNFKLFSRIDKLFHSTLYEVVNAISKRIEFLVDAKEKEFTRLMKEANKKRIKVNQLNFELPKNYGYVFLQKTPTGILIQN